jgi:isochorismate synthase
LRENLFSYLVNLLEKKLPFLLLRTANDKSVRILSQRDQQWHKQAPDNMSYAIFSKFQKSEDQVFINGEVDERFIYENVHMGSKKSVNFVYSVPLEERDRYVKCVEKAVDVLKEGRMKKVVLSRKQSFSKRTSDLEILTQLLDQYPEANCYFFHHPEIGKWIGATPEILLHVEEGKLQTMSLAGTALYKENKTHVWGQKELQEQQLVTDFITENLYKNGALHIEKSELKTVQAGSLIHLRTDINASIDHQDIDSYIKALHPTPAVCGMPRDVAMEYLSKNENYDRSFYTGYLGMVDPDKASYFVNLRCMELHSDHVDLYIGGGITKLSNPESEYQETVDKLDTMKKLLY